MKKKHLLLSFFALFCSLTICLSVLCFSSKLVQTTFSAQTSDINGSSTINLLQNTEGNSAVYVYSGKTTTGIKGEWSVSGDGVEESDMNKITIEQNTDAKYNDSCRLKWTPIDKNTVFNLTLKFTYNSNIYSKNIKFNILNVKDVFAKKYRIFSNSDNYSFASNKSEDIDFTLIDSDNNTLYSKIDWEIEYLNILQPISSFHFEAKENSATFHFRSYERNEWNNAGVYRIKISASFLNDGKPTLIDSKSISIVIRNTTYFDSPQEYIIFDTRKQDVTTTFYTSKYLTTYEMEYNGRTPLANSTITLKLRDGSDLPTWLKFDYTNRRFSFIPKTVPVSKNKNYDIFISLTWSSPEFNPVNLSIQFIYDRMYVTDESDDQNEISQFCLTNGSTKKMHINHTNLSIPTYPETNSGYSYSFSGNEDDALIELSKKNSLIENLNVTLKTNVQTNFSLTITRIDPLTAWDKGYFEPDYSTLNISVTINFNAALFVIEGPTQLFSSVDTEGYGVKNASGIYDNGDYKYTAKVAQNAKSIKVDKDNVEWSIDNDSSIKPVINFADITDIPSGYNDDTAQERVNINWNDNFSANPNQYQYTIGLKNKQDQSLLASLTITLTSLELYSSSKTTPAHLDEFFTYPGSSTYNTKIAPVVYYDFLWNNASVPTSLNPITKWIWHNSDPANYYRINFSDTEKPSTPATFHTNGEDASSAKYKDSEDVTVSATCSVNSTNFILKRKLKVSSYKYEIIGKQLLIFDALTTTESPEYVCKKSNPNDNYQIKASNIGYELMKADALHDDPPGGVFSTFLTEEGKGKIKVKGSATLNSGLYKFRLLAFEKNSEGLKRYFASLNVSLFVIKITGHVDDDYYTPHYNNPTLTVDSFFGKENWTTAEAKNHIEDPNPLPNEDPSHDYVAWNYYFANGVTKLSNQGDSGLRLERQYGGLLQYTWVFAFNDKYVDYTQNISAVINFCLFPANTPSTNPDNAYCKIMLNIPIHQDYQQATFVSKDYNSIYLSPGTTVTLPVKHANKALEKQVFRGDSYEIITNDENLFSNQYVSGESNVNVVNPNFILRSKPSVSGVNNTSSSTYARLDYYFNDQYNDPQPTSVIKNLKVGIAKNIDTGHTSGLYAAYGKISNVAMMGYINSSSQKACHFEMDVYATVRGGTLYNHADDWTRWSMDVAEGEGEKMIYSWDGGHPEDTGTHVNSYVKIYVSVIKGQAKYRIYCHPLGGTDAGDDKDEFSYNL